METQFLKELIESNSRVILPEFGAFLVKDDGTGVFKPQNVTFSPFLRYNDGMVEEELASKLKIGKDQAKEQLDTFVEMMKSELQSNKIFVIPGLGSLQIDNRGSIQFSASQSTTPSTKPNPKAAEPPKTETKPKPTELKATPPNAEKPKVETAKAQEPEVVKKEQPIPKVDEPKAEVKTPPPSKSNEKTKPVAPKPHQPSPAKPVSKPKQSSGGGAGRAILFGTLIGIGFVVVAASGWYLYSKGIFSSDKKRDAEPTIEKVVNQSTEQQGVEKGKFEEEFDKLSAEMDQTSEGISTQQPTKAAEKKISKSHTNTEPTLRVPVTQEGMFHIIAGSFRNAEYAMKFSDDMQSSGYNSRVLAQPTGMHAVTLGSFLTRQQAVDSMNVWKQKNPNIWILNQ